MIMLYVAHVCMISFFLLKLTFFVQLYQRAAKEIQCGCSNGFCWLFKAPVCT